MGLLVSFSPWKIATTLRIFSPTYHKSAFSDKFHKKRPRARRSPEYIQWIPSDSNREPSGYEPDALTNWAKNPDAPQCRIGAYSAYQFKGDRISSQLPESNRRTRLCPFSCCVSAGLPRQGEKMLLYSLMRKKPDNFLSRHCYYSMSCRRGCKEKPPFLQIFFSFPG